MGLNLETCHVEPPFLPEYGVIGKKTDLMDKEGQREADLVRALATALTEEKENRAKGNTPLDIFSPLLWSPLSKPIKTRVLKVMAELQETDSGYIEDALYPSYRPTNKYVFPKQHAKDGSRYPVNVELLVLKRQSEILPDAAVEKSKIEINVPGPFASGMEIPGSAVFGPENPHQLADWQTIDFIRATVSQHYEEIEDMFQRNKKLSGELREAHGHVDEIW